MMRQIDNCIIFALCNNPEELQIPDSPADSVLSRIPAHIAPDTQTPRNTPLIIAGVEPPMLNSLQNLLNRTCQVVAAPLRTTFAAVANSDYPAADEMKKGLSALDVIGAELSKLNPPMQRPLHMAMWHTPNEGGQLKIKAEWDACGLSFAEDSIRTIPLEKNTAIALCCSTLHMQNPPDLGKMGSAVADVFFSFIGTLNPTPNEEQQKSLSDLQDIGTKLRPVFDSFKTFRTTLGDSWQLVINRKHTDSKNEEGAPVTLTEQYSTFVINVQDKANLRPAWQAFLQTAEEAFHSMGMEEDPILQSEYTEHTNGNITFFTNKEDNEIIVLTDHDLIIADHQSRDAVTQLTEYRHIKGLYATIQFEPIYYATDTYEFVKPHIDKITGGTLHLTTEAGTIKLQVDIPCPGIQQPLSAQ